MQLSTPAAPHTRSSGWAPCAGVVYLMWWCSVQSLVSLEVFSRLNERVILLENRGAAIVWAAEEGTGKEGLSHGSVPVV